MFNPGDKLRKMNSDNWMKTEKGTILTFLKYQDADSKYSMFAEHKDTNRTANDNSVNWELVDKPHEYKDLIIKWANGKSIQILNYDNEWIHCVYPSWMPDREYRLTPDNVVSVISYAVDKDSLGNLEAYQNSCGKQKLEFTISVDMNKILSVKILD